MSETLQRVQIYILDMDCADTQIDATGTADAEKQAEAWAREGDWDLARGTIWVLVGITDQDGERHTVKVTVDPDEPACAEGQAHSWNAPHDIVGGCEENPGVVGSGGGVKIWEVCAHCDTHKHSDTWAQDPSTGEQGLHSVRYESADAAAQ